MTNRISATYNQYFAVIETCEKLAIQIDSSSDGNNPTGLFISEVDGGEKTFPVHLRFRRHGDSLIRLTFNLFTSTGSHPSRIDTGPKFGSSPLRRLPCIDVADYMLNQSTKQIKLTNSRVQIDPRTGLQLPNSNDGPVFVELDGKLNSVVSQDYEADYEVMPFAELQSRNELRIVEELTEDLMEFTDPSQYKRVPLWRDIDVQYKIRDN